MDISDWKYVSECIDGFNISSRQNERIAVRIEDENEENCFCNVYASQMGTYQKIWNGKEDNEHLSEIIESSTEVSNEELQQHLYNQLEERYTCLT